MRINASNWKDNLEVCDTYLIRWCGIVTILEVAEVRIGFYGRGGEGSSEGTLPRVPKAQGVTPRLIMTFEVRKIL